MDQCCDTRFDQSSGLMGLMGLMGLGLTGLTGLLDSLAVLD